MSKKIPPLVIFGMDAGDPDLIQRWAHEGYLPAIASIMQRGSRGRLLGPELASKHGIWISLFSGVSRSQHGYYNAYQIKPGTYDLKFTSGRDAKAAPFWSLLHESTKKIAVMDVPDIYPVKGIKGFQLSDWATHNTPPRPVSEPADLVVEARKNFGPCTKTNEKFYRSSGKDFKIYRGLLRRIERKGLLWRTLLDRDYFDLIINVFGESHAAGHRFWQYHSQDEKTDAAGGKNPLSESIREVYQAIDREIGLCLAKLPEESHVFILSSTGIREGCPTRGLMEAFCYKLGYQFPEKYFFSGLRPLAMLQRLLESFPVHFRHYLPVKMQQYFITDQFRNGTDWRKTIAFSIPSFYTSLLRINLRGREPYGIIQPGEKYNAVLDRLESDLKQLVNPETGEPAVRQVTRTHDLFGNAPPVDLPDLFIEWNLNGHFAQRVTHPKGEIFQQKPFSFRGNQHTDSGFFAACGPAIQRGVHQDVSLLDLAPTFLSLMGEPEAKTMAGHAVPFLKRAQHPPAAGEKIYV